MVFAAQSVILPEVGLRELSFRTVVWMMYLAAGLIWVWGRAGNVRRGKS